MKAAAQHSGQWLRASAPFPAAPQDFVDVLALSDDLESLARELEAELEPVRDS